MTSQQPDDQGQRRQQRADERFMAEHQDDLSSATQRAKWIYDVDEREDFTGQTLATRSRAVIRQWAEQRKVTPATAPEAPGAPGAPGVAADPGAEAERALRFDFPDAETGRLEPVSWEEFFQLFDERGLVFVFQQHTTAGEVSDICRFERPASREAEGS